MFYLRVLRRLCVEDTNIMTGYTIDWQRSLLSSVSLHSLTSNFMVKEISINVLSLTM